MNIETIIDNLISVKIGKTRKKIQDSIKDLMPNDDKLNAKVPELLALLKNSEQLYNKSSDITDVKALNIAIKKIDILTNTFNKLATEVFGYDQGNFDNAFFVKTVLMHMKNDTTTRKSYKNLDFVELYIKVWGDTLAQTYDDHKDIYPNPYQTLRLLALGMQEFYNELFIDGDKNQRKNKINQFSDLTVNIIKKWSDSCLNEPSYTSLSAVQSKGAALYTSKDHFDNEERNAIYFFKQIQSLSADNTLDGLRKDFNTMNKYAQDWLAMKLMGQKNGKLSLKDYVENRKNLIESRNRKQQQPSNRSNTPDSLDSRGSTDNETVGSSRSVSSEEAKPNKTLEQLISLFNNPEETSIKKGQSPEKK